MNSAGSVSVSVVRLTVVRLAGVILAGGVCLSALPHVAAQVFAPPGQTSVRAPGRQAPLDTPGQLSQAEAERLVDADLAEAVEMIDNKKSLLLMMDFLNPALNGLHLPGRVQRGGMSEGLSQPVPEAMLADLRTMLNSARAGSKTFNRTRNLVQIDFVIKPEEVVTPGLPATIVAPDQLQIRGSQQGLGTDFRAAIRIAIGMLENNQIETFVRATYPLPELARLTNGDELERLIIRLKTVPAMKSAMIETLTAVRDGEATQIGERIVVSIPPQGTVSAGRTIEFSLIDGHWRFADPLGQSRNEFNRLVKAPAASRTVPGSAGQVVLKFYPEEHSWRLATVPVVVPLKTEN
ncbi:MAG: hypothetical protein KDA91_12805 [Planctomycetaceae bacterium]|nr:hypothetical protein [Planctomycetaceae bacterium]